MKPFSVLGRFATCLLGLLWICIASPESVVAKVKNVTASHSSYAIGGLDPSSSTDVCNLTCDGYVYITADSVGNTLVYNNETKYSTDSVDLIDLSSNTIAAQNTASELSGKVDPDYFKWKQYRFQVTGANTSASPVYVKMDGGEIGELVLGGGNISAINLEITGGSIQHITLLGNITGACNVTMSNCTLTAASALTYDSEGKTTTWKWSQLTLSHGKGMTYTYPHEMIRHIKELKTNGATINMSFVPNSDKVYEINNATDFYWFEDYVNQGTSSMNGKLMNDVDVNVSTMIGTHEHPFKGVFDGNGKRITNSYISKKTITDKNTEYAGIFGFVQGESDTKRAVIKNLTVEGNISSPTSNSLDLFVAGGVVGIADKYVEISDVVSSVKISNTVDVKAHIGGIVGTTQYSSDNGPLYIDRCTFNGTISQSGSNCCGGIVGYIYKGHIHDCLNAGTIKNVGGVSGSWVSGILGYVNDYDGKCGFTMQRCLNVGEVSGSNSYAIGFANNCKASSFDKLYYLEGASTPVTNGSGKLGDCVQSVTKGQLESGELTYTLNGGATDNPAWRQTFGTDTIPVPDMTHKVVYNTYADCKSTVQYSNVDNGRTHQGHDYVDGICSFCKGVQANYMTLKNGYYEIENDKQLTWFAACVNAGNTSAKAKLMADITLSGSWTPIKTFAGIFDGQGHTVNSVSVPSTTYAGFIGSNAGEIKNLIIGSGDIYGVGYVGGICGENTGIISNCANFATINKSVALKTTTYFGGICGLNRGSNAKVENCYNVGKNNVKTTNSLLYDTYASSLGYAKLGACFTNCYYLSGTSSAGILGSTSSSSYSAFSQYDFINGIVTYRLNQGSTNNPVWRQNLGSDNYPVLDTSHKVVYYGYADCSATSQSYHNENHPTKGHGYTEGWCKYCSALDTVYLTANSDGYYELSNLNQLKWFAAYVNAGHESIKAKLTKDVSKADNVMIGTHEHPFKGEFDGNGFQVSGLNQVSDFGQYNETTEYAGLFGYVLGTSSEHAVIKNLKVEGTITYGTSTRSSTTYFTAGGVVGIADQYVEIADVVSYVNINIERDVKTHVGGIAGTTEIGTINGPLYLDRCTYRGTIKQSGHDACAGIVGCICSGHIYDCVNFGTIQNVGAADKSWVSGIVGYASNNSANNFSMKRCLNIGAVTGDGSYAFGYLRNCPAGSFDNLYYKSGSATSDKMGTADFGTSIHEVSVDQLKSGEVTYALNGGNTTTPTWYQTIGSDTIPVFDSSHKVVYNTYADCESTVQYSNVNNGRTTQGHLWDEGTITTRPTCTAVGVRTCTCTFGCGTQQGFDVAAKGHTEEDMAAVAPTCTKTGLTAGKKCSVCDSILVVQTEVAAKGHTEEVVDAIEPTCTETGLTEGKKCSVCDSILVAQTEVAAKGHTRGELKSDYSAHWYPCENCWEELDYETHNHDAADHSCSVCGVDVPTFAEDGILIGNSKQMYWLMGYMHDYSNVHVKLTDDIVLNENLLNESGELNLSEEDLPVWQASCFGGTFDGQGHYISGLFSKNPYDKAGLFLTLDESATVRNLEIRDSYFEASYAGAITALANESEIQNCASINNVIKGDRAIGGLVGRGRLNIANCISTCQLQKIELEGSDGANAGLLVGCIDPDAASYQFDATVENCFYATDSELGAFGTIVDSYDPAHHTFSMLRVELKDLSAFRSGEVAYLLNQTYNDETDTWTSNEETPVWRQNLLGTRADTIPVLNPSHNRVVMDSGYSYTIADGKQFGTFCYGVDAALPEGMAAFGDVYVDEGKIFGTKVEDGVIPAGTPVVLRKSSKVGDMTISVAKGYNNALRQLGDTCVSGQLVGLLNISEGQLLPKSTDMVSTYTMQTHLINGEKVQNFYKIESDILATQYRCYLNLAILPHVMMSAQRRAECIFDCETGLQSLSDEEQSQTPVYNLQGQRVQRMDRGGIYIQNNKRIMIK